MHPCLEQADILELIFKEIYYRPTGSHTEKDLLALALTCQRFKEPALDTLWDTQLTFGPLIKTLGISDAEKESENDAFDRDVRVILTNDSYEPSPEALRRFSSYARRIRRISHVPDARSSILEEMNTELAVLVKLSSWVRSETPGPMFPNLQHLGFIGTLSWTSIPCLIILLESKITTFSMYWGNLDPKESEVLIGLLGRLGLSIEFLELTPLSYIRTPIDPNKPSIFSEMPFPITLSWIIPLLKELRSLSCGSISLNQLALQNLASRCTFYKLQSANTSDDLLEAISDPTADILSPFATLQHLELFEDNFRDFIKLVDYMQPLALQTLILHHTAPPTASTLADLLHSFSEGQHIASLRQFSIKHTVSEFETINSVNMDIVFDGLTLSPLLSFPNLLIVEIDTPCGFDLRDADIRAMAKAWPQLRRLQLGSKIGWGLPPSVTLVGISELLIHCPRLEDFVVPFGARTDPPPITNSTPIKKNMTYLYVGNGRAPGDGSEQMALARFLKHVFPDLCGVGGEWMYEYGLEEEQLDWAAVISLIKTQC
ncbi:hypothetical protein BDN70DRAFT_995358 [Pholiota conissans]|uniref:F-box domain-containing protein n=1 Tax=Pholiota conissans TaxID=109636 RepID=A0A9P6CY21_9AGAR|nr:hypothetical protein BDN70DRAFT_995358 [Pholiota conissans]